MSGGTLVEERALGARIAARRMALAEAELTASGDIMAHAREVIDSAHVILTAACVVGLVLVTLVIARGAVAPILARGSGGVAVVGAGERVSSPHWTVHVDSVERVPVLGPASARGTFLVVRLTVQRRDAGGGDPAPSDFELIGADGLDVAPEPMGSGVYSTPTSDTQLAWAKSHPAGIPVRDPLVFDVGPGAKDLKLLVREASTAIRLP
ncbi:MAG: hypothetical protein KGN00_10365 [Chloroflexota bacterium]|nr:hypothetical protein [Chloroflexota bacterium]MDE3194081.1 hypothetical protein [Chloroflexota bacterium]